MKVIFLDVDGVLNSSMYDRDRQGGGNVDVTRLPLLRDAVQRTGANVVLSSSWRCHWDPQPTRCDAVGAELEALFRQYGIELYDKTPAVPADRAGQIRAWLDAHPQVERFVIVDDERFGWGDLQSNVVNTHYRIGRGLEEEHADAIVRTLYIG